MSSNVRMFKGVISSINCIGVLLFIVFAILFSACSNFAAGSYPYAERYEVSADENKLIRAIEEFKISHPQYIIPDSTRLQDGRISKADIWYHVNFYMQKENIIIKAWVRNGSEISKSAIGFVGFGEGLDLKNYKRINKDCLDSENEEMKRKFKNQILKSIIEKL